MFLNNSEDKNDNGKINFNFKWEYQNLNEVPLDTYKIAEDMVEHGMIKVHRNLIKDKIYIEYVDVCTDSYFVNELYDIGAAKIKSNSLIISPDSDFLECQKAENRCEHAHCPILVAGYLYYIKYNDRSKDSFLKDDNFEDEVVLL